MSRRRCLVRSVGQGRDPPVSSGGQHREQHEITTAKGGRQAPKVLESGRRRELTSVGGDDQWGHLGRGYGDDSTWLQGSEPGDKKSCTCESGMEGVGLQARWGAWGAWSRGPGARLCSS